jgi:hypothetical protein
MPLVEGSRRGKERKIVRRRNNKEESIEELIRKKGPLREDYLPLFPDSEVA